MKIRNWILMAVVLSSVQSLAWASELPAVRGLKVTHQNTCRQPDPRDPRGATCGFDFLVIDFVARTGGTCHHFEATVVPQIGEDSRPLPSLLTIQDFPRRGCTRPEQLNAPVTLFVEIPEGTGQDLRVANPTYIERFLRR